MLDFSDRTRTGFPAHIFGPILNRVSFKQYHILKRYEAPSPNTQNRQVEKKTEDKHILFTDFLMLLKLLFYPAHISDSFVSLKKVSQRRVANRFEALNLSFQMVYSRKSEDMHFMKKKPRFCTTSVTEIFNRLDFPKF